MPYIKIADHKNGKERKFLLGIHRATVVNRNDDSSIFDDPGKGRIQVEIPYLNQDGESEKYHFWCDACFPSHQFFSVPDVGTMVYVMFNGGNPEQPIWIGAVNTGNASKDPPSRFRRDTPDVSGYESLKGHFLEFDDIDGERHIRLEDLKGNYFLMDSEEDDLEVYFQHDERRTIDNDRFTTIGNDDQLDVGNDNRITIGQDQTQDITRDQTETIGRDQTLTVENDQTETIRNDRTQTVENDDSLTVQGNKTQDITGTWDDTITDAYSMTGQSTGDWTFQDTVTWDTQGDFDMTVQQDWKASVTGDADWSITGDWKGDVTGSIEFDATQNIELKATQQFEAEGTLQASFKNSIFTMEFLPAVATWSGGASTITMTPASVTIAVGGTSSTWTAGGYTFSGSSYFLQFFDALTHLHPVFAAGIPTGGPF